MALKDHLNKVEYFCSIVEQKSFLQASYKVGISQPQLSRVVKILEDELNVPLLVRSTDGIEPTSEGWELYNFSSEVLQKVNSMELNLKNKSSEVFGEVKVGTYDSIGRYFFPPFLKYIKATAPKLELNLETSRSSVVFKKLKSKEIDIAVVVDQDNFNNSNVEKSVIYEDAFGFYQHPSLIKEFKTQLILFSESIKPTTEAILKSYDFKTSLGADNLETVRSLCEEGVGVGLLPHRVARESVLQGKLTEFKRLKRKNNLYPHKIVLCRYSNSSSEVDRVVEELSRFLASKL